LNTTPRTMKIGNEIVYGVEIDWEKRDWKRIYTPEEEMERVGKMLRLNGGPEYSPATERLLAASSLKEKPTVRIKRLSSNVPGIKLKGASSIIKQKREEREKAEKVLKLLIDNI
jgi:hypothetical protein